MKIKSEELLGHGPINILYPGNRLTENDSGIGSIARIDYALFKGANLISMHPHANDEILTYLRSGNIEHRDSEGIKASLHRGNLMLMKAGKRFYHEEKILDSEEPLEALQIFIRSKIKDMTPQVSFHQLSTPYSVNKWRLIASPDRQTKLQFTSQTWIYDIRASAGLKLNFPKLKIGSLKYVLFIFNGQVKIDHEILNKKDSFILEETTADISCIVDSDMVLFITDASSKTFKGGMFSGNIR